MKNLKIKYFFLLSFLFSLNASSQVVIGGTTIDDGAIFQMKSDDKGLMIPKVALTSRNDIATITPALVEGLWVYNTANAGSGLDRVSPGFYFWDSAKWVKIYDEGFTVQYEQTSTQRSNNSLTVAIPGLDQEFLAPYTGTYEIHVSGYIAAANHSNTSYEATVLGSYMLEIENVIVAEALVSSNTKITPPSSAFQALGRQVTMVYNVDLSAGTTYNIRVRARLWQTVNVNRFSLNVSSLCGGPTTGYSFWGICSGPYNGNSGLTDNAQDAYLTITLIRQY